MTKIPTQEQCLKILKDSNVPDNIIAHTTKVCEFSMKIVDLLERKGIKVDRNLVAAGALLHDVKKLSPSDHIVEGYEFIKSLGYPEVANIMKKHGLVHVENEEFTPKTWEEKIVFYADKRVKNDKIVSLDERFEYAKKRYNHYDIEKELEFTKKIERELLGNEQIG